VNWIDSPLSVYHLVPSHPAQLLLGAELGSGISASSVYVLLEVFAVLTRDYSVPATLAIEGIERVANFGLQWAELDVVGVLDGLLERVGSAVESADALLLSLARADNGVLVTPDRRLLRAARAQGVAARDPITIPLSREIAGWEDEHLAPKGMPRALRSIERWLRGRDTELAAKFVDATDNLTTLPF
jgi:predicted nucleic acid-binding protein